MKNILNHKLNWYVRLDKTHVLKRGQYKLLEIFKRPHKGYCCFIYDKGEVVCSEGYHGTSLPQRHFAVRLGCKKARELKLMK